MSQLPPELIALIIDHIPSSDKDTLQSCSSAALAFRNLAQRRFNETLTVTAKARPSRRRWITFTQACTHLDKYPHLAQYVRTLVVRFAEEATCSAASIRNVLERMQHVHNAILADDWLEQTLWSRMPVTLVGPVLAWLSTPPSTLQCLEIWYLQGLEKKGMRCFLHAAPLLSFMDCGIRQVNYVGISTGNSKLRHLRLRQTPQAAALLGQSHLAHVSRNIRTLSLEDTEGGLPLCLATTPSLEALYVDGQSAWNDPGVGLVFAKLRKLQIAFTRSYMDSANGAVRWFTSGMFFRFSAPALEDVVLRATGMPADGHLVYAPLMDAIATFLQHHAGVRRVEWCVEFASSVRASWEQRRAFQDGIRKCFPQEDQKGTLVFRILN